MTALTKSEMAERLFEELGLNKREAKEIVEDVVEDKADNDSEELEVSWLMSQAWSLLLRINFLRLFRYSPTLSWVKFPESTPWYSNSIWA